MILRDDTRILHTINLTDDNQTPENDRISFLHLQDISLDFPGDNQNGDDGSNADDVHCRQMSDVSNNVPNNNETPSLKQRILILSEILK